MNRKILVAFIVLLAALLVGELAFLAITYLPPHTEETTPATTEPTIEPTAEPTAEPTTEPTAEPTTEPEILEQFYTLTLAGDCTLGSVPAAFSNSNSFIATIGEDYGYPFRGVLEYFENDDFTIINLESVLADGGTPEDKLFTFRGPTAYSQILTSSSVEAVTLANNHTYDFGL